MANQSVTIPLKLMYCLSSEIRAVDILRRNIEQCLVEYVGRTVTTVTPHEILVGAVKQRDTKPDPISKRIGYGAILEPEVAAPPSCRPSEWVRTRPGVMSSIRDLAIPPSAELLGGDCLNPVA